MFCWARNHECKLEADGASQHCGFPGHSVFWKIRKNSLEHRGNKGFSVHSIDINGKYVHRLEGPVVSLEL